MKLGSSRDRSSEQASIAKKVAEEAIGNIPPRQPIVFTDGSANPNPGPCGAAAICYAEGINSIPITISSPVAHHSTSYHGELEAIRLAVDFCKSRSAHHNFNTLHLFSDCQAAMLSLSSGKIHQAHQSTIDNIQATISELAVLGVTTNIHWVAGNVNLKPNELADQAAKHAVSLVKDESTNQTLALSTIKKQIKSHLNKKWQREWNRGETGRNVYELCPIIPSNKFISIQSRRKESKLLRIISGHSCLKDHMHKLNLSESPCCECSDERQTVQHIVMDCPLYNEERKNLQDCIESIYVEHNTPMWERVINLNSLLMPTHNNIETRNKINNALINFIDSIHLQI